ncbi:MAG: patatin-like phospholipase family protein [Bacteroidales bacterium]|nr:patatin-like phospholipase family protein [Bacteroidales bacterium]MBN2699611.1 patatin-like phospholipase family protein [Bacteroidales bacterium]
MKRTRKHKLGIVLSGGAARGFAHPGVLKALHEFNMEPEIIAGASAGAIAGGFYADGYEPEEILELFKGKRFLDLARLRMGKTGLLEVEGLRKLLRKNMRAKDFDGLKKEFVVSVTNFRTGEAEYLTEGDLVESIIASSSIPVLFTPVKLNGKLYIDGGVVDNFPVGPIREKCKKLVGVAVNPIGEEKGSVSMISMSVRAFHLSMAAGMKYKRDEVDIYIEPEKLKDFSLLDVKAGDKMFKIGYEAAREVLSGKSSR